MITEIQIEFQKHKRLAEQAIAQVDEAALSAVPPGGGNSIATICWHVSGNLRSRFTDFLTADGEKPWRKRDEEFEPRGVTREELLEKWEQGWAALGRALAELRAEDLSREVTIRGERLTVTTALLRALGHVASHVGQIVYAAKASAGERWNTLSIPLGQSEQFTAKLRQERP